MLWLISLLLFRTSFGFVNLPDSPDFSNSQAGDILNSLQDVLNDTTNGIDVADVPDQINDAVTNALDDTETMDQLGDVLDDPAGGITNIINETAPDVVQNILQSTLEAQNSLEDAQQNLQDGLDGNVSADDVQDSVSDALGELGVDNQTITNIEDQTQDIQDNADEIQDNIAAILTTIEATVQENTQDVIDIVNSQVAEASEAVANINIPTPDPDAVNEIADVAVSVLNETLNNAEDTLEENEVETPWENLDGVHNAIDAIDEADVGQTVNDAVDEANDQIDENLGGETSEETNVSNDSDDCFLDVLCLDTEYIIAGAAVLGLFVIAVISLYCRSKSKSVPGEEEDFSEKIAVTSIELSEERTKKAVE